MNRRKDAKNKKADSKLFHVLKIATCVSVVD